jgi:hypothetical protein
MIAFTGIRHKAKPGKRRPKYSDKGKLTARYYLHELTALQEKLVNRRAVLSPRRPT